MTPCSFTYVYRRFGETYFLNVQGQVTKLHHIHTHTHTHTHQRQIAVATKFCAVAPNIYWSSVWNHLAPIIVIWVRLLETLCTLGLDVPPTSVLLTATSSSSSLVRIKVTTNGFRYMTELVWVCLHVETCSELYNLNTLYKKAVL